MDRKSGPGMPERRAWSPREVAKRLGVSPATVYRAIRVGDLYARQWGTRYIVPTEAIDAFVEGWRYSPDGPPRAKRPTAGSSGKRTGGGAGPSDQPVTEPTAQRLLDHLEDLIGHLAVLSDALNGLRRSLTDGRSS